MHIWWLIQGRECGIAVLDWWLNGAIRNSRDTVPLIVRLAVYAISRMVLLILWILAVDGSSDFRKIAPLNNSSDNEVIQQDKDNDQAG